MENIKLAQAETRTAGVIIPERISELENESNIRNNLADFVCFETSFFDLFQNRKDKTRKEQIELFYANVTGDSKYFVKSSLFVSRFTISKSFSASGYWRVK